MRNTERTYLEKLATPKFDALLRAAPPADFARHMEAFLSTNTRQAQQQALRRPGMVARMEALREMRAGHELSPEAREHLVRLARDTAKQGPPTVSLRETPGMGPTRHNVQLGREHAVRAASPVVRLSHETTLQNLLNMRRTGASGVLDGPTPGKTGFEERLGIYAHIAGSPHDVERSGHYGISAGESVGGTPARLEFDYPRDLTRNPLNAGYERVIPRSLWGHATNQQILVPKNPGAAGRIEWVPHVEQQNT